MSLKFYTQYKKEYGTSLTRGYDIARRMKCSCDEGVCGKDDTAILVKCLDKRGLSAGKIYCDIVDWAPSIKEELRQHTEITIIVQTPQMIDEVRDDYPNHKIIYIPHPHCNWERCVRPDREVCNIAYNGNRFGFMYSDWAKFVKMANKAGFKCYRGFEVRDRKALCEFYKIADIAVSFRTIFSYRKAPSKLCNTGSFRIPTISRAEPSATHAYEEGGTFVQAESLEEMIEGCIRLRDDKDYYNEIADAIYATSCKYHIDEVIENFYSKL